jgi:hypothetical protein
MAEVIEENKFVVITAYEPNVDIWEPGLKRRKQK